MKTLLKLIRESQHKTQLEMAKKYGVVVFTWHRWEHGQMIPPLRVMLDLQRESGIPIEVIFFGVIKRNSP